CGHSQRDRERSRRRLASDCPINSAEPPSTRARLAWKAAPGLRRQGGRHLFLKGKFHERHDEEGQALVEYALILALITVFALGALQMMSGTIVSFLNSVASALEAAL